MSPWIKGYHSWYLTINCKVILGHFGYINKISQNLRACCLIFQMNCFPVTCWDSLLMGSMFLMNSVPNGRKNGVILSWWGRWTNDFAEMLHQPAPTFVSNKSFAMFTSVCMQACKWFHSTWTKSSYLSHIYCFLFHSAHSASTCTIRLPVAHFNLSLSHYHRNYHMPSHHVSRKTYPSPSRHELICQRSPPSASYRRSEATS